MDDIITIDSKCCKELYVILNKLDLFNKLPNKIRKYISNNQNLTYNYDFDIDIPLIYQINSEKTRECISYLYIKYINDNMTEKELLLNKYHQNEKEYQEQLANNDILKSRTYKIDSNVSTNELRLVEYKESIFTKIFNKIKSLFFKNHKTEVEF